MASWKQRRAAARARLRSGGRAAFLGLKGRAGVVALPAATGVAASFGGQMLREKVNAIGSRWWGEAAALLGGSFLMANRKPNVAHALAGAAGYAGGFAYKLKQFQEGKGSNPVPQFAAAVAAPAALRAAAPTTSFYDEASSYDATTF